ncbi:ATP-dependent helicase [Cytobacillus firmus]|uniref:DNA helicase n=1 Tax=Cytobacillus firmus DS1 TaxID=1307436 RepID=W7KPH8_CYTFI|nr:ATP-dependent helicase [Cytobacillus firmus]EWG09375.1 DNA helicase [Cytobacillus firmus DS1]
MDWSTATKLVNSKLSIPIDQHFKLCAGPGAGKTTFLIHHIRRILTYSTRLSKSRRIACITYTNTGVETIRSRLKDTGEDIEISTIHSFLYTHVVKPYLWLLNDISFPLDRLEGHDEIKPSYTTLKEYKQRTSQFWIKDDQGLSNALSKLSWVINKQEEVELGFLKPYHGKVEERFIKKNSYLTYKEICWEQGMMSHDDVLYFSYLILKKHEKVKEIIRAKFPYFLIDEFQDTSPIQVAITTLLAEKEITVGVIGDPSQSIYSFQGANGKTFSQFNIKGMSFYILENNHRSTIQIISVLNHMRNDKHFIQHSPDNKVGNKPVILIGDVFSSYRYFLENVKNDWCVLSYKNEVTNRIKYDIRDIVTTDFDLFYRDNKRGRLIYFVVHALEYGRQMKLKDAIKYMKKAYRSIEDFTDQDAFRNLKRLLNNYEDYYSNNIKDFYNTHIFNYYGVKSKITKGEISEYYENLGFDRLAAIVNIADDKSFHKTIHKAKGDEFKNVLVISSENNYNKQLDFLLSPDMSKEEHRVFYVV